MAVAEKKKTVKAKTESKKSTAKKKSTANKKSTKVRGESAVVEKASTIVVANAPENTSVFSIESIKQQLKKSSVDQATITSDGVIHFRLYMEKYMLETEPMCDITDIVLNNLARLYTKDEAAQKIIDRAKEYFETVAKKEADKTIADCRLLAKHYRGNAFLGYVMYVVKKDVVHFELWDKAKLKTNSKKLSNAVFTEDDEIQMLDSTNKGLLVMRDLRAVSGRPYQLLNISGGMYYTVNPIRVIQKQSGALERHTYLSMCKLINNRLVANAVLQNGKVVKLTDSLIKQVQEQEIQKRYTVKDSILWEYKVVTETINIPDVVEIKSNAFKGCICTDKTEYITIPATVKKVDWVQLLDVFTELKGVVISADNPYFKSIEGVVYTKDGKGLLCYPQGKVAEQIDVPEGVTYIGTKAFYGCKYLRKAFLSNSVLEVRSLAFSGCRSLCTFTGGTNLRHISNQVFLDCESLVSVNIGKNVISIAEDTFKGCINLKAIKIAKENTQYACDDGGLYTYRDDGTYYLQYVFLGSKNYTVSQNVTKISEFAFMDYQTLRYCVSIKQKHFGITEQGAIYEIATGKLISCPKFLTVCVLPDYIKSIGSFAFKGCTGLEQVLMSKNVDIIESKAFLDCVNLKQLEIPRNTIMLDKCVGYNYDDTQYPVTLSVARGSAAEHYALENFVEYKTTEFI